MIFEQVANGGCQSYLIGCGDACVGALIDPEVRKIDRYRALAAQHGVRIQYIIDTHTHADHFSASKQLSEILGMPVVAHRNSPAPYIDLRVDEGDVIKVGNIRLTVLHTPGHTRDAICLVGSDRVFTGDTLLIGATAAPTSLAAIPSNSTTRCSTNCLSWTRDCASIQRTSTRAVPAPPSRKSCAPTPACRSAIAASSSR